MTKISTTDEIQLAFLNPGKLYSDLDAMADLSGDRFTMVTDLLTMSHLVFIFKEQPT